MSYFNKWILYRNLSRNKLFLMLLCGLLDTVRHSRYDSQLLTWSPKYGLFSQCTKDGLCDKQNTAEVMACHFQD